MYLATPSKNRWSFPLMALLLTAGMLLSFAAPSFADDHKAATKDQATPTEPEAKTTEQESAQEDVEAKAEKQIQEKRRKLVDEAITAVQMTNKALNLLSEQEPKTDDAIAELEKAVGKLELVIVRNPDLATIPVAVNTKLHDVIAQAKTVETSVDKAEKALADGRVQDARRILDGLASEYVVSTTHLPLASYPKSIRAAVPLIDKGKIAEAKTQIQTALNLLVVNRVISPLPLMRAEAMLAEAEDLTGKDGRKKSEDERLAKLLNAAREELEFGQTLGYYNADQVEPLYKQIEDIEGKTMGGKSGEGFFDKLKKMVSDLF